MPVLRLRAGAAEPPVGRVGSTLVGWFSANGQAWQRIAPEAFDSSWPKGPDGVRINNDPGDIPVELTLSSAAAGSAGYVVAGEDGRCIGVGFCSSNETVIWVSSDGWSWTRIPSDERFSDGYATAAVAWGSRFVVAGVQGERPAIWISGAEQSVCEQGTQ